MALQPILFVPLQRLRRSVQPVPTGLFRAEQAEEGGGKVDSAPSLPTAQGSPRKRWSSCTRSSICIFNCSIRERHWRRLREGSLHRRPLVSAYISLHPGGLLQLLHSRAAAEGGSLCRAGRYFGQPRENVFMPQDYSDFI